MYSNDELTGQVISISYVDVSDISAAVKNAFKKYREVAPNENCWSCPSAAEKSIRTRRFNVVYTLCETMGLNAVNTLAKLAMADPNKL